MNTSKEIARHIREIYVGNNWTDSCIKDVVNDISWQEAIAKPIEANTIAMLVFHMNFYLNIVHERLSGGGLNFTQEESFDVPAITNEADWQQMLHKTFEDAETFAQTIEQLSEERLSDEIAAGYGSVYKNLHGIAEHNHYHLGQIVLLKKIIRQK
jgi:uncharacterized damage-inducible protein DinB